MNGWKGEFSDDGRKLTGTVQTWRTCSVIVRSRHEQQRLEKLGRRQSTTVYDGRSVMTMTPSEDDLEPLAFDFRIQSFAFASINKKTVIAQKLTESSRLSHIITILECKLKLGFSEVRWRHSVRHVAGIPKCEQKLSQNAEIWKFSCQGYSQVIYIYISTGETQSVNNSWRYTGATELTAYLQQGGLDKMAPLSPRVSKSIFSRHAYTNKFRRYRTLSLPSHITVPRTIGKTIGDRAFAATAPHAECLERAAIVCRQRLVIGRRVQEETENWTVRTIIATLSLNLSIYTAHCDSVMRPCSLL